MIIVRSAFIQEVLNTCDEKKSIKTLQLNIAQLI